MKLRLLQEERGSVAVLFALALVALLAAGSIVIDGARLYVVRQRLDDVAVAGALAGAQELPESEYHAIHEARDIVERNGIAAGQAVITASDDGEITVELQEEVFYSLARSLGFDSRVVAARATVRTGTPTAMTGLVPLGVEWESFHYGSTYTLKAGGGKGQTGNYGALAYMGTGARNYEEYVRSGYPGVVGINDQITTEPGNMAGPTKAGLQDRIDADPGATYTTVSPGSPRLLYMPVIEYLGGGGRTEVRVVGFAAFFLESVNGGEVKGRFLRHMENDEVVAMAGGYQSPYGLRSLELIE